MAHDNRKFDPMLYVHSPDDLASGHVKYAMHIQSDPGVKFGLPEVDERVIPLRAGNCIAYCARPGHGKSSMMGRLANLVGNDIIARDAMDKELVLYVTWEQTAEELEVFFESGPGYTVTDYAWGRISLREVKMRAGGRVNRPIWVIGHSVYADAILPPLYLDVVEEAVQGIVETFKLKPRLMCFDYAQLIPSRNQRLSKTERVDESINGVKELLVRVGCPGVVGVQAGRQVDQRDWKVPQQADAQHCSAIEQTVDKFFGFWRPWLTEDHNDAIPVNGLGYPNSSDFFVMEMSKQRFEDGRFTWPMYFSPAELKIESYELVKLQDDDDDEDDPPAPAPKQKRQTKQKEIPF